MHRNTKTDHSKNNAVLLTLVVHRCSSDQAGLLKDAGESCPLPHPSTRPPYIIGLQKLGVSNNDVVHTLCGGTDLCRLPGVFGREGDTGQGLGERGRLKP